MTTIAFRDGLLAADSAETGEDLVQTKCEKLFRKRVGKSEAVIGTAGGTYSGMMFVDWFGSNKEPPEALLELDLEDNFEVLVVYKRKVFTADRLCRLVEVVEPYCAVGSGRCFALTAMDCGKSATEAVKMAAKRDAYTRGPIVTWNVTDIWRPRKS